MKKEETLQISLSNVVSTKSNVASTLLPKTATLSKQQATFLLLRQCCVDIVASVDRVLHLTLNLRVTAGCSWVVLL